MTRLLLMLALAPTHTPAVAVAQHASYVWDGVHRERFLVRLHRAWHVHSVRVHRARIAAQAAERSALRSAATTAGGTASHNEGSDADPQPPGQLFTATAYAPGCGDTGQTATGTTPHYGTIAVDPTVIPLGSAMSVDGYGSGVAEDTGGAIHGSVIDLWFPTCAQALAWGVRSVAVSW